MSFSSFLGKSFLAQADFCEASYDSLPVPKSYLTSLSETTSSGNNHNQSLVPQGYSSSDEPPTVPAVVSVLPLPEETSKGRTGLGAGVKGYTSVVTRVVDNFVNIDPDAEGIRKVEEQQKAERLAELRDAAAVAAIRSKFPEPLISSSANKQKHSLLLLIAILKITIVDLDHEIVLAHLLCQGLLPCIRTTKMENLITTYKLIITKREMLD